MGTSAGARFQGAEVGLPRTPPQDPSVGIFLSLPFICLKVPYSGNSLLVPLDYGPSYFSASPPSPLQVPPELAWLG